MKIRARTGMAAEPWPAQAPSAPLAARTGIGTSVTSRCFAGEDSLPEKAGFVTPGGERAERAGAAERGTAPPSRKLILALLVRLVVNGAVPVLAYVLLRPHVHSDVTALVVGAAIPLAFTAGVFAWHRRLDPAGVIAVVCFGIGLLVVAATGGNELAFKLREDIWTGPLGLACLVSAAVRRPVLLLVLQFLGRRNADIAERIRRPGARRICAVSTVTIGLILLVHAVTMIIFALTTSTAVYLAVSRPVGWVIVGGGLAALVAWIRLQHRRTR